MFYFPTFTLLNHSYEKRSKDDHYELVFFMFGLAVG